ncbi:hypothetical protein Mpsy_1752 [Methanolobus psychrophilus R15]|nr:hypothetical protein Mpsy_1752 [Methanolobus psychrophilus R15]
MPVSHTLILGFFRQPSSQNCREYTTSKKEKLPGEISTPP